MVIDNKTVMAQLFKADGKTYISVRRFQDLLLFLYSEIVKRGALNEYDITFDKCFEAIERTVLCNFQDLDLDNEGDIIYLRGKDTKALAAKYPVDEDIAEIINNFTKNDPA